MIYLQKFLDGEQKVNKLFGTIFVVNKLVNIHIKTDCINEFN